MKLVVEAFGAIRTAGEQPSDPATIAGSTEKQRAVLVGREDAVIADPGCTSCTCRCALSHGTTCSCRLEGADGPPTPGAHA